jgi:nicotinate-nucleotide adenylyltransferase
LGILGGTFDPVHQGHLILAAMAHEQLALDWVSFVPAGQPWRKARRTVAPAEHRVRMLQLATAHNSAFDVVTVEAERPGPSYTSDTLEWFREQQSTAELFFILGQDALADLPNWHRPGRILELASLALARRPGGRSSVKRAEGALPGLAERVISLSMPRVEISASEIRRRVREGLPIRYLVPDPVEAYIREQGLYR